ncbi:LuxR C-terminal-related transcriptional regulator [Roseibium marinum]|uniref:LuxR C-terminal-related transcriptional regulator n=1 Tax=Roseibium marinum TaxID=281252 RepID=UPI000CD13544|nr:LuxR C-terminal-related transcriptional regulator [Roseibium marinum]
MRLLARPELEHRLISGLDGQVVLIHAPAGYGKTEVMAKLFRTAERRGREAVWFSLKPEDGLEDLQRRLAEALSIERHGPDWLAAHFTTHDRIVELYFDDVDRLKGPELFSWLLDRLPDTLRIVIAGRRLPELRLSRLRMRGLLAEISDQDLRFNRGETRQLLGSWLTTQELDRAGETLNGWPALMRLALIELEHGVNGLERAALVEGESRVYREFLLDEVIPNLDEIELKVLKAVEGLDNFTLRIASSLAELPFDYHTLRQIEQLSPLIQTEEQNAGWFRLSTVVSRALAFHDIQEDGESRKDRHIRAAKLFAENGNLAKSVLHASIAGEIDLAIDTIEQAGGVELFLRAGYTVLRGIIDAVPHSVVLKTPSLRLCRAVMLGKTGQIQEARAVLDALLDDTRAGRIPGTESWVAMLRHIDSLNEVYEDRAMDVAGIARLREEADGERNENTWRLGWIYNHLTICYTRLGDLEAAKTTAQHGLSLYREERSSYPQAFMLAHLAFIDMLGNNFSAAFGHLDEAFGIIHGQYWNDANLLAIANVPLAGLRYRQGQTGDAGRLMQQAIPIMETAEGWVDFYVEAYGILARVRFDESGIAEAEKILEGGVEVAEKRDLPRLRLALSILRMELQTWAGLHEQAERGLKQWPHPEDAGAWPTVRERRDAALAIGRLRLRQDRLDEALALLAPAAKEVRETRRADHLIRVSLLLAEIHARKGDDAAAVAALNEAALLAHPGGQIQHYRDEGRDFAEVIRKLVRRVGLRRMGHTTSQYLASVVVPQVRRTPSGSLLSRREREVLTLLAEGMSNKSIARRLDVGEPTVKFHLKNLFAKLGVSRRALAVNVARTSGLLD